MSPAAGEQADLESRRVSLLSRVIAVLASLASLVLGGIGLGFFLSPAFQRKEDGWVDLGRADAFKPDKPTSVEYVERKKDSWVVTEKRSSAWVVMKDGEDFTVFDPRCPHLGCPYRWDVKDKQFLCPCHTAAFAIDGKVLGGPPPRPLDRYPVKVIEGELLIQPKPTQDKP